MNKILIEIVIDTICFFELIPDEVLDPDIAIRELEGIGGSLKQLSLEERKEFVQHIKWMAESTLHPEKKAFLLTLPENIGLRGDGEVYDEFS